MQRPRSCLGTRKNIHQIQSLHMERVSYVQNLTLNQYKTFVRPRLTKPHIEPVRHSSDPDSQYEAIVNMSETSYLQKVIRFSVIKGINCYNIQNLESCKCSSSQKDRPYHRTGDGPTQTECSHRTPWSAHQEAPEQHWMRESEGRSAIIAREQPREMDERNKDSSRVECACVCVQ